MARMCDPGKHVMVPMKNCNFKRCKVCKRYFIPIIDFSVLKEYVKEPRGG